MDKKTPVKELVSIQDMPTQLKINLLKALGYDSDGTYVLKEGKQHEDKYIHESIELKNMLILPGTTTIIDNNSLSIASYLEEYGDVL
jgi:hypothetical protein